MRTRFLVFSVLAPLAFVPLSSGCNFLEAPDVMPTPTPVPPVVDVVFDPLEGSKLPADGAASGATIGVNPQGFALNSATDLTKPFAFRCVLINAPDNLVLQPVYKDAAGKEVPGTPDTNNPVVLAGIVVPPKNTAGYAEAMSAVQNWAIGRASTGKPQNLDVFQDPVFPTDAQNRRRVQIFFKGAIAGRTVVAPGGADAAAAAVASGSSGEATTPVDSSTGVAPVASAPVASPSTSLRPQAAGGVGEVYALSLNRMLVRAGWAVVDLYSPTSFDQKAWLFDETYARTHTLLVATQDTPSLYLKKGQSFSDGKPLNDPDTNATPLPVGVRRVPDPLGLWKYGVLLQQRIPAPSRGTGARSTVTVVGATGTGAVPSPSPTPFTRTSNIPGVSPKDVRVVPIQPPTNAAPAAPSTAPETSSSSGSRQN